MAVLASEAKARVVVQEPYQLVDKRLVFENGLEKMKPFLDMTQFSLGLLWLERETHKIGVVLAVINILSYILAI